MKKKRLNLRKLWFSLFLFVGITASASPGILQVTEANDVAQIGETKYQSLQEAFNAANTGDVIILLKDYNAASESMAGGTRQFVIKKSITLNGQGYTLTTKEKGIGIGNVNKDLNDNINVTIKNITIQNTSSGARCIDTRGYVGSLTLENVTLKTDGASGTTQPLTIGGNQADPATIHITNSTIQTNDAGTAYYAIITYNPVNMTISDSTIKGWACIYAKGQDGSAGSAGSVYTIDRCELVSSNAYSGVRNAFSAFMIEDNNVSIQVTNTDITINNTGDQLQTLVGYPSSGNYTGSVTLGEGNTINFAGPNDCSLLMNSDPSNLTITGGSYNFDPTPYLSDDFKVVNVNGEWVIQEKVYVAQIGTTRYETLAEAVAEVKDNETILMIADVAKTFTVDFQNHTYTLNKPGAGSTGTETSGFQLLKNSNIVFKNGTVNIAEDNLTPAEAPAKNIMRIIQNYANLTLDNMTIDGTNQYGGKDLVISFNNGTSVIKDTKVIAGTENTAFDVCTWSSYKATGLEVTGSSEITGSIEISSSNQPEELKLTLTSGTISGSIVMAQGADKATVTKSADFTAPRDTSGWKQTTD